MRKQVRKVDALLKLFYIEISAAVIGYVIKYPFELLALVNFIMLVWHHRQIMILSTWLWNNRRLSPPVSVGLWEHIFDGINRMQKVHRRKRNDLSILIKRFKQGSEALPDAVVIFKKDLTIVWCNKLAQQLLGLKWPEDHGQRFDNLLRHPHFVTYFQDIDYNEPHTFASPVNDSVTLEFRCMPYTNDQFMLLARDVTQLKQLEQMRKDFVANVSHELRTPLTVLQGYLEMFDGDSPPPPVMWKKAQSTMIDQAKRMDSLVSQLLKLSKIESSPRSIFNQNVSVPALLESIKTSALALNEKFNHDIVFDIDPTIDMLGDSDEMQSVFSNLIYNAIYYTPPGGNIHIKWFQSPEGVVFSVEDNGEGIPEDKISRLTERFFRMDKARSRSTGGSGLGLAIVKHILSRHDSHLQIVSTVGEGSCFYFIVAEGLVVE